MNAQPVSRRSERPEVPVLDAIVLGAGGVGRLLIRQLGEAWSVTVVDPSNARLRDMESVRRIKVVRGDGSSRVVLERAGLHEAEALIAATDDDAVNIEACRLAREAGVPRIAAAVAEPEHLPEYATLGVQYFAGDQLAAARIARSMEPRGLVSTEFANGRAVAIEFHLSGDSPVRGKQLMELHAQRWVAGAILRDDQLIVPHGATVLEAGDVVTVVGAAADFSEIVRTFTAGEARFPLQYGTAIAVVASEGGISPSFLEAAYLTHATRAEALVAISSMGASESESAAREDLVEAAGGVEMQVRTAEPGDEEAALRQTLASGSVGVLVVPAISGGGLLNRLRVRRRTRLGARHDVAVLFSRGTHPYGRVLVPARLTPAGRAAARAGIDIARSTGAELHGLAVAEPGFIGGGRGQADARAAVAWLKDEASVQGVRVEVQQEEGNPVRLLLERAREMDLVVMSGEGGGGVLRVSVTGHVARLSPTSVLVVPTRG